MRGTNKSNKTRKITAFLMAMLMAVSMAVLPAAAEEAVWEEETPAVEAMTVLEEETFAEEPAEALVEIPAEPVAPVEEPVAVPPVEEPETQAEIPAEVQEEQPAIPEEPENIPEISDEIIPEPLEGDEKKAEEYAETDIAEYVENVEENIDETETEAETEPETEEEQKCDDPPVTVIFQEGEYDLPFQNSQSGMLDTYVTEKMAENTLQLFSLPKGYAAGDILDGANRAMYDKLRAGVKRVADGNTTSTIVRFNASDFGLKTVYTLKELGAADATEAGDILRQSFPDDAVLVFRAVLYDCPGDFYWCLGRCAYSMTLTVTPIGKNEAGEECISINDNWYAKFTPIEAYRGADTYSVDTQKTALVVNALQYAQSIVADAEAMNMSDYDTMAYYRDVICGLTEYDYGFADTAFTMISVFDRDESTKAVCSGYSKAFQYLCDLTDFNSSWIQVSTVYGYVPDGGSYGSHAWNIVRMEDGKNYLVDVTWCDATHTTNRVFMNGYYSHPSTEEYSYYNGNYKYYYYNPAAIRQEYPTVMDSYSTEILALSATDYAQGAELPAAPSLTSAVGASDGVSLTWTQANTANGYRIYRSVVSEKSGFRQIAVISGKGNTTYTDKSAVPNGTKYWYKIAAYNDSGLSNASNIKDCVYFCTPVIESITNTENGAEITWTVAESAPMYNVYRKTGSSAYTLLAVTPGTTYIDNNAVSGTEYSYAIACRTGDGSCIGNMSAACKNIWLTTPAMKALGHGSSFTSKGLKICWNESAGAETYQVFRHDMSSGAVVLLATVNATSYTDTSIKTGKTYKYTVTAKKSDYTSAVQADGITTLCLASPQVTGASNQTTGVKVTWNAVKGATKYCVYRKPVSGSYSVIGYTTDTSYIDTTAVSGQTYYYAVKCVDANNIMQSYYTHTAKHKYLAAPTLTIKGAAKGNVLTWTKTNGAAGYRIYRRTASSTKWTRIATIKGGNVLTYTDTAGKNNTKTKYFYVVRAYNGDCVSSASTKKAFYPIPVLKTTQRVSNGIKITWKAVSGITQYQVYRKTGSGKWVKIGVTSNTSFVDKTAKKGKTYRYAVRCLGKNGTTLLSWFKTGAAIKY